MNEFVARAMSLIRRYTAFNKENCEQAMKTLTFNRLVIVPNTREVFVDCKLVELTAKEFDLLYFLSLNQGKIFTKKQIYNRVWENDYAYDDSNIMSFISKLRRKIEADPHSPYYILTVHGVGYRFNQEV